MTEKKGEGIKSSKNQLANQITELCHGKQSQKKHFQPLDTIFGKSQRERKPSINRAIHRDF